MFEDGKPRGEQQVMQISNRSKRECGEAETKLETCPHFGPDPVPDLGLRCKHRPPKTLAADGHDAMANLGLGTCVHQSRSDEKPSSHARLLELAFGRDNETDKHAQRVTPDDTLTSNAQWTDGALPVSRRSIGPNKRFPSPWVWCCTPKRSTHCFHCVGACVHCPVYRIDDAQAQGGLSSEAGRPSVAFRAPCPTTRKPETIVFEGASRAALSRDETRSAGPRNGTADEWLR